MAAGHDAQQAGERVEALLAERRSHAGPQVAATAEELVSCLVELYGAGLAEIVRIIGEDPEGNGSGPRLMAALVADPLVESLLLLHDLHPLDVGTRVRQAIEEVRPKLGPHAGRVEFAGVDDRGVILLRLERSGHGCQSSSATVQAAIEQSVAAAAPEAAGVQIDVIAVAAELPLLQITRGPAAVRGPGDDVDRGSGTRERDRCRGRGRSDGPAPLRQAARERRGARRGGRSRGRWDPCGPRRRRGPHGRRPVRDVRAGARRPARAPGRHREAVAELRLPRVLPAVHP